VSPIFTLADDDHRKLIQDHYLDERRRQAGAELLAKSRAATRAGLFIFRNLGLIMKSCVALR
jgi:hypothetical protein